MKIMKLERDEEQPEMYRELQKTLERGGLVCVPLTVAEIAPSLPPKHDTFLVNGLLKLMVRMAFRLRL